MLDKYDAARGWGKDGLPTRKKPVDVSIGKIADELETAGKLSAFG